MITYIEPKAPNTMTLEEVSTALPELKFEARPNQALIDLGIPADDGLEYFLNTNAEYYSAVARCWINLGPRRAPIPKTEVPDIVASLLSNRYLRVCVEVGRGWFGIAKPRYKYLSLRGIRVVPR